MVTEPLHISGNLLTGMKYETETKKLPKIIKTVGNRSFNILRYKYTVQNIVRKN